MYKVLITSAGSAMMAKGNGIAAAMTIHATVVEFSSREDALTAVKRVNEANPKGIAEVNNEFVQTALLLNG